MGVAALFNTQGFVTHESYNEQGLEDTAIHFKQVITRPLQLATLVLTLSMGWLFLSAYHLLETQAEISKIDTFRFDLILFQRSLADAETGQRGYLITNNPTFLEPYKNGAQKTADILNSLANSTVNMPELAARIELLRQYSAEKFRIIDASIQVQLHAGAYASHLTLSKDKGKVLMERIESIVKDMDNWLVSTKIANSTL